MMANNSKRKEQKMFDKLEKNLASLVMEESNIRNDDKMIELRIQGIENENEVFKDRIQQLQSQVNVKEL